MMRWISSSQEGKMDEVMLGQVSTLREQMVSASSLPEPELFSEQPPMHPMIIRRARFQGGM